MASSADQSSNKGQVVVYGLAFPDGQPSFSPFVLKLETFLILAKIPNVRAKEAFVPSSKGKIPWISYNGDQVADSELCVEYLNKKVGIDLNRDLSKEQKAIAHAFRVMMDEFHNWCHAYFRFYTVEDTWLVKFTSEETLKDLHAKFLSYLQAQGVGRHTEAEVLNMFKKNLQILQDYLGDKAFLMGETPTEVDCSVYGHLGYYLFYTPRRLDEQLGKDYVKNERPKLYEYFLRMKELTYPNYKF